MTVLSGMDLAPTAMPRQGDEDEHAAAGQEPGEQAS